MPEKIFNSISDNGKPPIYKYFNGSKWKKSESKKTVDVISPIDGKVAGTLQIVTKKEIDEVFKKAKKAQEEWESTPLHERVKIMHLAADWIRHYQDYLAAQLAREIGKVQKSALSEIKRTADLTDYFADEVLSIRGETLDSDNFPGYSKGRQVVIERVAYGVVVAIAPFNYPVNLSGSKIVPALLMGNSVVFKPPTQGGISGLHLTQLFIKAGVPEGVISCVTGGGGDIGNYLVSHKDVDMITFTGNSETGCLIAGSTEMVPLVFECGGNNPAVVYPDADMKLTATEIVKGAYSYSGQRCTAIKYVIGTKDVLKKLLPFVKNTMDELIHMGDPRDKKTKMVGPVISEQAAEHIKLSIDESVKEGAKIERGGKKDGAYIEPTILTHATPRMSVVKTEVFGPVLSFIEVSSMDEAVRIIKKSKYGLQACVFTQDEGHGLVFAKELNVGTVQINGSPQRGPDHFPFMGVKKSGLGVQGVKYSLEEMSRLRSVVINNPK